MHVYVTWGILWTDQLMSSFITPERRDPIEKRRGSASIQPTYAFFSSPHRLDYLQPTCISIFISQIKLDKTTGVIIQLMYSSICFSRKLKSCRAVSLFCIFSCVRHSGVWALWPYRLFTQQIFIILQLFILVSFFCLSIHFLFLSLFSLSPRISKFFLFYMMGFCLDLFIFRFSLSFSFYFLFVSENCWWVLVW
jgi:hypothetical protein